MGVYSTAAASHLRENRFLENFQSTDLLEFAANCESNNQKMFNAIIEMDFHDAVNRFNNGYSYLYEADDEEKKDDSSSSPKKKNIFKRIADKIVEMVKKFIAMVGAAFNKFKVQVQEFVGANKRLVNKIGAIDPRDVQVAISKGKDDITSYEKVTFIKFVGEDNKIATTAQKIDDTATAGVRKMVSGGVDNISENVKSAIEDIENVSTFFTNSEIKDEFFKEEKLIDYIKDTRYVQSLQTNLIAGYKESVKNMNAAVQSMIDGAKADLADIEKYRSNQNADKYVATSKKYDVDYDDNKLKGIDDSIATLNGRHTIISKKISVLSKLLTMGMRVAIEKFRNDRAAYAKLGDIILKSKKKSTNEAALLEAFAIEVANDQFIDSIFE